MKIFTKKNDLNTINKIINGEIIGTGNEIFDNVAELLEANENSICFFENEKYFDNFKKSKAGLIIVSENLYEKPEENQIFIKVKTPYVSFMTIVSMWLNEENKSFKSNISNLASINKTAKIGENVHISPFVVIEENVVIEKNSYIGANTVIMKNCKIGEYCKIFSNVSIYDNVTIGNGCIVHSGVVIGADGFGFIEQDGIQLKIPQVGDVVIEDDVEIGANTCIDRATIGTTVIKNNTKIDNLVQIGHNCTLDEHSILCAQVGLAGNSHIGSNVYLAGQVGVSGHLKIENNTMVGAQSGVANNLNTGKYFGSPAINAGDQKRIIVSLKDLPKITSYVKKLILKENKNNEG